MKNCLTIIILLFTNVTIGQTKGELIPKSNIYGSIITLTRIDTISKDIFFRNFHSSTGYCGYTYRFDKDFQFTQNLHCCISDSIIDKGSWQILNTSTIELKSLSQTLQFSLVKLNNFYFLVPTQSQQKFIEDINNTVKLVNKKKLFKRKESVAYRVSLSCSLLSRKYYSSEII